MNVPKKDIELLYTIREMLPPSKERTGLSGVIHSLEYGLYEPQLKHCPFCGKQNSNIGGAEGYDYCCKHCGRAYEEEEILYASKNSSSKNCGRHSKPHQ